MGASSFLEKEKITDKKTLTILFFIIGLTIILLLFKYYFKSEQNAINYFSIIGTYASIYGIVVGIIQIVSIKENVKLTKIEVFQTVNKIDSIFTISELASSIKLIEEIHAYMLAKKYQMALIRLRDLKKNVIENSYKHSELNKIIPLITTDINNLMKLVYEETQIKEEIIRENLEKTSTILIKLKTNLNPLYNVNK